MAKGYVYVLSNPSMPGVVKIGKSNRGGRQRAIELYATGVPTPFVLEFEILVDDAHAVEQAVHDALAECRVTDSREFFRCFVWEAIEAVLVEYASFHDSTVVCMDEFEAVEGAKHLAFNCSFDVHPFEVCHAIRFIDDEAVESAIGRWREWRDNSADGAANGKN